MTTTTYPLAAPQIAQMALPKPRLLTATVLRLFAVDFGAMCSFYLLLGVVPLFSADRGIGNAGAGLSIGVLMIAAVAGELAVPGLARRTGYGRLLICGLILLGAPALALPAVTGVAPLLAISVLRGLGFAIVVVAIGAMAALAIPKQRQGEGMGMLGVVAMLPAVLALPLGVWLADHAGYPAVFAAAAASALVTVVLVPRGSDDAEPGHTGDRLLDGLRGPGMKRPILVFTAASIAGGVVVAFLPGAVTADVAVPGLFAQAAVATLVRWLAGRYCDKHDAAGLLLPAILLCAGGMGLASLTHQGFAVLAGMAVFGAGYGLVQSASLNAMLQRASRSQYGAVNAAWNAAYDLGWGVGAITIGLVVTSVGFPIAFLVTALVALAAAPAAFRIKH